MDNFFARLSIPHFFRYLLQSLALTLAFYVLLVPGLIWLAKMLKQTGGRSIDLLFFVVPIVGTIIFVRHQWRYCSAEKYWEPQVPQEWPAPVAA